MLDGEQPVGQLLSVVFFQAEGKGLLFRLAGGVQHDPACAAQTEQYRPLDGERGQCIARDGTVEPEEELPVDVQDVVVVQRPAARVENDPADAGHQREDDKVLLKSRPESRPVPLEQNVDEGQQVDCQRLPQEAQG